MANPFPPPGYGQYHSGPFPTVVPTATAQSLRYVTAPSDISYNYPVQGSQPSYATLYGAHAHNRDGPQYQQPTPEPSFQESVVQAPSFQSTVTKKPQIFNPSSMPTPFSEVNATSSASSKAQATEPQIKSSSADDAALLLTLAEDYLSAAYHSSSQLHDMAGDVGLRAYYKAIATALGCFETVLARCPMRPEQEATVRLRYASILYQETENEMEAEEALSKGIAIADRHKLFDLKYNLQHLLIRVLHRSRPPAAFKYLDRAIQDVEVYHHIAWVYAFTFLKASLHLDLAVESVQESKSAIRALNRLIALADHLGDEPVMATACTMKAWACLSLSDTPDSFEESQTSLALARKVQDKPCMHEVPHVRIMMGLADLCGHLQNYSLQQIHEKWEYVGNALDNIAEEAGWYLDGSFNLHLHSETMPSCRQRAGVIALDDRGQLRLRLHWIPKGEIYTIALMLRGLASVPRKAREQPQLEALLVDAIKKESDDQQQAALCSRSLVTATSSQLMRQHLTSYMRLRLAFVFCCRSDFDAAQNQLNDFNRVVASWTATPTGLKNLARLLEATCLQGNGRKDAAWALLQTIRFPVTGPNSHANHFAKDISRIAIMNSLLLLQAGDLGNHNKAQELFKTLSDDCPHHRNAQIRAAYLLIQSLRPEMTSIGRKQTLQYALNAAKANSDRYLLSVILSVMFMKYFQEQLSDQAEKNARAAQNMAIWVRNKLWMTVANGALAHYLEAAGRPEEAFSIYQDAVEATKSLSKGLKQGLGLIDFGISEDILIQGDDCLR